MTNAKLLALQNVVNEFIDRRRDWKESDARFVGTLAYLWLDNPGQKLLAKIDAICRFNALTLQDQRTASTIRRKILEYMASVKINPKRSPKATGKA